MRKLSFWLAVIFACNLAGCGAGSGSSPSAFAPASGGSNTANVTFKILIPDAPAAGSAKHRAFVSPSANGALVTAYAHSDTSHATPLASVATNISSSSSACTAVSGGRSCTVSVTAPAGDDDFVFGLYDTAPANGAIPSTAHELGIAGVTQTINAGTTNTVTAPIEAIVAGFSASTTTVSEVADGRTHTVAFVISPTDFGNNPITAGSANAPYANPIAATVSETGGSGHTLLSLNGGTPAASVTLTKATDTVQAVYDGGGTAGYAATVTLTALPVNGQGGATTESLALAPALFVTNPTVFFSPSPAQLNAYPEGQHVLSISEPTAASGTTYTATPAGCNNILSLGTVVGKGASATLLVVGGLQPSSGGCSVAISDGTLTFNVSVTNTLRSLGTPQVIHEYPTPALGALGIVTGADGNLWFTETGTDAISSIHSDGTNYTTQNLAGYGFASPWGAALGPDGKVWFGDFFEALVASVTTSGTVSTPVVTTSSGTDFLAAGLDGNIWFAECQGTVVGSVDTSTGAALPDVNIPEVGSNPTTTFAVALGSDGAIWYDGASNYVVGRISGGVATNFSSESTYAPEVMTAGSDGATWFAETLAIGRMPTSGALSETAITGTPNTPNANFVTTGPDGAVWFTDYCNNAIGRIDTSEHIVEYPVPTANAGLQGITVGPDGNIWFVEGNNGNIGVLQL
jgi:streptogramin lyase